jgi:flavodoxin
MMKKIGIVYATKTTHSQQYAEAIGKALNVQAENIAKQSAPQSVDLLFIVSGIYGGKSLPELVTYVQSLDHALVKQAALVTSNASKKLKQKQIRRILDEKGIQILDEIICPGSFLFLRAGHPNQSDMQMAADFAIRLAAT